ncbi:MAG: Hpt domain-containing protein, partial [Lachnospiraceae bacterium]|nr:Hpt domain-containing protein [Lachnospiraceae bacterium]
SERIGERDLKGAFEAAHALKGVLGNLSLTPLYEIVCEITELLRAQTDTDYLPYLARIAALRADLKVLAE